MERYTLEARGGAGVPVLVTHFVEQTEGFAIQAATRLSKYIFNESYYSFRLINVLGRTIARWEIRHSLEIFKLETIHE